MSVTRQAENDGPNRVASTIRVYPQKYQTGPKIQLNSPANQ